MLRRKSIWNTLRRAIGHKTDSRKELRPTWRPIVQRMDCEENRKAEPC